MAGLVVDGRDFSRDSAPSKRSRAEYDLRERERSEKEEEISHVWHKR